MRAIKGVSPNPVKIRDFIQETKDIVLCNGIYNISLMDHPGLSADVGHNRCERWDIPPVKNLVREAEF